MKHNLSGYCTCAATSDRDGKVNHQTDCIKTVCTDRDRLRLELKACALEMIHQRDQSLANFKEAESLRAERDALRGAINDAGERVNQIINEYDVSRGATVELRRLKDRLEAALADGKVGRK